jgi:hypothetical protein
MSVVRCRLQCGPAILAPGVQIRTPARRVAVKSRDSRPADARIQRGVLVVILLG